MVYQFKLFTLERMTTGQSNVTDINDTDTYDDTYFCHTNRPMFE